MKLYALIIAAFLSTPSFAAEVSIEMLNKDADGNRMVYSQEVAKVEVGDTVTCYGKLKKVGKTSISILLRVTTESWKNSDLKEVTNGKFIYVAIDSAGKPRQLPSINI